MIIPCPQCQARLNLPEDTSGIEVRCPGCRHVFRATAPAEPPKRVLPPKPAAPHDPLDDDPYEPPRPRRFEDDRDLREPRADTKVIEDNAREHTRLAGQVMLAAGCGTLVGLIANRGLAMFQDFEQGLPPNNPELIGALIAGIVFRAVFFGPLLLFMLGAGRNLLRLGPRGMINGGIAVSFVAAGALALGVLVDLITLAEVFGGSSPLVVPQMVVTGLSCGVCLTAGILAIRALSESHVRYYYDLQRERFRRYRY
jgi:predicted Zn finger-like uncharacterized protein